MLDLFKCCAVSLHVVASILMMLSSVTGAASFTKCGLSSNEPFRTWFSRISTDAPVVYPRNDAELRRIIRTARDNNCRVRPVGAGYSENGVVVQATERNVVVVSLKNYVIDDSSWDGVIIHPSGRTPSVRMSAADTNLKMMSIIRPQGYITISQTTGRIFNLAGLYLSPSTHGTGTTPRITEQLLSVRVMNADGIITVYSDEATIRAFRGSSGLLGIVTALEVKIAHYPWALEMSHEKFSTASFTMESTKRFIRRKFDPEAGAVAGNHTLFFYYPYADALVAHSSMAPTNQNERRPHNKAAAEAWYKRMLRDSPYEKQARSYRIANHPLVEMFPGQGLLSVAFPFLQGFGAWKLGFAAEQFENFMLNTVSSAWDDANKAPNDGLFHENIAGMTPPSPQVDVIGKCWRSPTDCVDDVAEWTRITRNQMIKYKTAPWFFWCPTNPFALDCPWYPGGLITVRRFSVSPSEMELEHLSPGMWLGMEMNTVSDSGPNMKYSRYFAELEDIWRKAFRENGIHLGKAYAFGRVNRNKATVTPSQSHDELPFQDERVLQNVFPDSVRDRFVRLMRQYDPSETFKAGSLLHLLGLTGDRYARPALAKCQGFGAQTCGVGQCCMGNGCSENGGRTCYTPPNTEILQALTQPLLEPAANSGRGRAPSNSRGRAPSKSRDRRRHTTFRTRRLTSNISNDDDANTHVCYVGVLRCSIFYSILIIVSLSAASIFLSTLACQKLSVDNKSE